MRHKVQFIAVIMLALAGCASDLPDDPGREVGASAPEAASPLTLAPAQSPVPEPATEDKTSGWQICRHGIQDCEDGDTAILRMPLVHGIAERTLVCGQASNLLMIKAGLNGRPLRPEMEQTLLRHHCYMAHRDVPFRKGSRYKYVGTSGLADGPNIVLLYLKTKNDTLFLVGMADDVR